MVLGRQGPDGKTLIHVTKSTRLGGGCVVASEYSNEGMTELSSEAPNQALWSSSSKLDGEVTFTFPLTRE